MSATSDVYMEKRRKKSVEKGFLLSEVMCGYYIYWIGQWSGDDKVVIRVCCMCVFHCL